MCVKRKGRVNLCTKCTNLTITKPHLSFVFLNLNLASLNLSLTSPNLSFTPLNLSFTPPNLSFKVPPVRLLSGSPGRAYRSVNGEKAPGRTDRHADRDKDRSNVSTYGRQTPDRDRDNRVGQVQYAHRYGFQKSSYLIFMCYISSKVAINHDIIKYIHRNNRLKPPLIDSNNQKETNAHTRSITFALLSSTA